MALFDDKNAFLKEISALKTLSDAFPKKSKDTPLSSLKQKSGVMDFVQDILKMLAGVQAIKGVIVNILSRELPQIETSLKTTLKSQLKQMINCGNDPNFPTYLRYDGDGINIQVRNTDFFGLFTIDPESEVGNLVYQDTTSGLNSKDMSTFLYNTIQADGTPNDWGHQTTNHDIMTVTFNSTTSTVNNVLNVKASQYYTDNKKLTDFNNDFIDSLTLLPTAQMFSQLIDSLLGSIMFQVHMPADWLKKQEEVNTVVNKISSTEETTTIDDSYFTFTNQEKQDIEETARNRSQGIRYFVTCDNIAGSTDFNTLKTIVNNISTASTKVDLETTVSNGIDTITSEVSQNAQNEDKFSFEMEFFDAIFKAIKLNITNTVLSPKLALIFQINNKIIYGDQATEFDSPIEFISKNRALVKTIFDAIKNILLTILVIEVIKQITNLMQKNKAGDVAEQTKQFKQQILSLVGISPALIKLINSIKI